MCMFCRSLLVLLYFFHLDSYGFWLPLCYLHTLLKTNRNSTKLIGIICNVSNSPFNKQKLTNKDRRCRDCIVMTLSVCHWQCCEFDLRPGLAILDILLCDNLIVTCGRSVYIPVFTSLYDRLSVTYSRSVDFSGFTSLYESLFVTYDRSVVFSGISGLCDSLSVTCGR
jgi:hypothetical protein